LRRSFASALLLLLLGATARAEALPGDPVEIASRVAAGCAANRQRMEQYSWKQRTELRRKGKLLATGLEQIRPAPDGTLERAPLDDPTVSPAMRKRLAKSAPRRVATAELQALLEEYAQPSGERIRDFLRQATMSPGDIAGTVRIRGRGVVRPGDELTVWVDGASHELLRTRALTRIGDDPAVIEIDHERLESGLVRRARQVVRVPRGRLTLTVESFDFVGP